MTGTGNLESSVPIFQRIQLQTRGGQHFALWHCTLDQSPALLWCSSGVCASLSLCVPSFTFPMFDVHSPVKVLLMLLWLTGLNSLPLTTRLTFYSATRLGRKIGA